MKSGKHIELLKTFTKEEVVLFEKLLSSPYFNSRNLNRYFKLLIKHYPEFSDDKISPKILFAKLFPGKKFNEKKIINLNYFLVKMIEEFFIQSGLNKNVYERRNYLLTELFERKLFNLLQKELNLEETHLKKEKGNADSLLLARRTVNYLRGSLALESHDFSGLIDNKQKMQEHLTTLFLIKMFEHLRDIAVAKSVYNINCSYSFQDKIYDSFNTGKFMNSLKDDDPYFIPLQIAYLAYKSASDIYDDRHYYKLKKIFINNITSFSRKEKYFHLSELISYCTSRVNEPNSLFVREMFEVIKFGLKNKIHKYSDEDYYQVASFRNVVLLCIRLREYDWLNGFIEKYSGDLNPEYRESIRLLAYSKLHFAKREFEKSLECISKINYDFFLFKIDIKDLLLMNFYELRLFEQAVSLIDAYRHFLSRTKEYSDVLKDSNRIFLNHFSSVLKAKMNKDKIKFFILKKSLNSEGSFPNKEWLLEKIEEGV